MAKVITNGCVNVTHPETYDLHTFGKGDRLPAWAEKLVTNPVLFEKIAGDASTTDDGHDDGATGAQAPAAPQGGTTGSEPAAFVIADNVADLKKQAKGLGVAQTGSKADLIARIEAKVAENAAASAQAAGEQGRQSADPGAESGADGSDDASASGDDGGTDRASLVARLQELGIEHDPEHSDEEIVALIEAAQE
ncbi:SAP domain-containing protein [Microbacterium sp. H37-C3]|jgi:hypothetical protein|uniref:SAP domain-containing protein n=1 Tax=Microbacterium sp. H37-C3 TaxID=3004354 RepID=UPI0022B01044|nr:SAP domain-containing protein [Microbacterium sp. H37-C3]MCZ4066434.1 SAP domain-containing protein [Microbacterium sp. H37-C3]